MSEYARLMTQARVGWLVAILLGGTLVASAPACIDEVVNPAPEAGVGGQGVGSSSTGAGGAGGEAPVKRTVLTRNPLGNVAVADNLLWDGDFEWLSAFADQYAWLAGNSTATIGYQLPRQVVGARCKSGVKCVELKPNAVVVGYAVSSKGSGLEASVHVRLDGDCAGVTAALVSLDDGDDLVGLAPKEKVGAFCRYEAVAKERSSATWLFVQNKSKEKVVVDDAVVRRAAQQPLAGTVAAGPSLSVAEVADVRRALREHARPMPRPMDEAERRFRAELERRRSE